MCGRGWIDDDATGGAAGVLTAKTDRTTGTFVYPAVVLGGPTQPGPTAYLGIACA